MNRFLGTGALLASLAWQPLVAADDEDKDDQTVNGVIHVIDTVLMPK